jgi:predicted HTH transcriptional regulator
MVGVHNDRQIVGWQPAGLCDLSADLLRRRVRPFPRYKIRQVSVGGKPVQLVVVEAGLDRPYRADGVTVVRSHGTTRDAESQEIRAIAAGGSASTDLLSLLR